MNVFYTNNCPTLAARDHCNVHQVKMIVEYAQLLSTAHHVLDGEGEGVIEGIYKKTHVNHPSAIWTRKSSEHYLWVFSCAIELCKLYTERTGKTHKTQDILLKLTTLPTNIVNRVFKVPPIAAPDEYKKIALLSGVEVGYHKYLLSKYTEWISRDKPIKVEHMYSPTWVEERYAKVN